MKINKKHEEKREKFDNSSSLLSKIDATNWDLSGLPSKKHETICKAEKDRLIAKLLSNNKSLEEKLAVQDEIAFNLLKNRIRKKIIELAILQKEYNNKTGSNFTL